MKATLTFSLRLHAEEFATSWSRFSKTGHIVGSGLQNVEVTVFDIDEEKKEWIESYIKKINNNLKQTP